MCDKGGLAHVSMRYPVDLSKIPHAPTPMDQPPKLFGQRSQTSAASVAIPSSAPM